MTQDHDRSAASALDDILPQAVPPAEEPAVTDPSGSAFSMDAATIAVVPEVREVPEVVAPQPAVAKHAAPEVAPETIPTFESAFEPTSAPAPAKHAAPKDGEATIPEVVAAAVPEVASVPEVVSAPEVMAAPEAAVIPEVIMTPEAASIPEIASTPEASSVPMVGVIPEVVPAPEVVPSREVMPASEAASSAEATSMAEAVSSPAEPVAPTAAVISAASVEAEPVATAPAAQDPAAPSAPVEVPAPALDETPSTGAVTALDPAANPELFASINELIPEPDEAIAKLVNKDLLRQIARRRWLVASVAAIIVAALLSSAILTKGFGAFIGNEVPSVVGMSQSEAVATLESEGFSPSVESQPTQQVEDIDTVIATEPAAGERVSNGNTVTVMVGVAAGETQEVPDYVGMSEGDAVAAIAASDYFVRDDLVYVNSDQPQGTIIGQDPAPGTPGTRGTKIDLTISDGPTD